MVESQDKRLISEAKISQKVNEVEVIPGGPLHSSILSYVAAATLDKADLVSGKIPTGQIPALALTSGQAVTTRAAMLALTNVQAGDIVAITSGVDKGTYILTESGPASNFASWILLNAPTDIVQSVAGKTGTVVLSKTDVGLSNVDNTADSAKVMSNLTKDYVDSKTIGNTPGFYSLNVLPNSSFESWNANLDNPAQWNLYWGNGGRTNSRSSSPRMGNYSGRTILAAANDYQTYLPGQTIRVPANSLMYAEAWFKQNTSAKAKATIIVAGGKGPDIGPFGADILETQTVSLDLNPGGIGTWQKLGFYFTLQDPQSTWVIPRFDLTAIDANASVEIDDTFLSIVPQFPNVGVAPLPVLTNIDNSASETIVAKWLIPANYFRAMDMVELKLHGVVSSTSTLVWRIRLGTAGTLQDALMGNAPASAAGTVNSQPIAEVLMSILSAGTAGTASLAGRFTVNNDLKGLVATAATPAINTTVDNYLTITLQQATAQNFTTRNASLIKRRGAQ